MIPEVRWISMVAMVWSGARKRRTSGSQHISPRLEETLVSRLRSLRSSDHPRRAADELTILGCFKSPQVHDAIGAPPPTLILG